MDSLSLLELNSLVRRSLEQCLPDEYWICLLYTSALASTYISWSKGVNCGWVVFFWNIQKDCWGIRMLMYCCMRFAMLC